jgi:hypothetical protein
MTTTCTPANVVLGVVNGFLGAVGFGGAISDTNNSQLQDLQQQLQSLKATYNSKISQYKFDLSQDQQTFLTDQISFLDVNNNYIDTQILEKIQVNKLMIIMLCILVAMILLYIISE